jgi:hypothetical protein
MKTLPYVLTVWEYSPTSSATTNEAAAADYERYMVFDVNFLTSRSSLAGWRLRIFRESVLGISARPARHETAIHQLQLFGISTRGIY